MRLSGQTIILLFAIQLFGLYIFLKGFLLTRQTFSLKGRLYPAWERFPLHQHSQHLPKSSLPLTLPPTTSSQKPFKRAIIILIDALRFDFAINFTETSNEYFLNHLPVISQLQQSQPHSSLLFQFRADPPTTTMQRIKGLMTGSLPTFIDAGANFASSAVGEDHLLRHIQAQYEHIYFMGDDTWVHLFPESFQPNRTFESDSFKMLDLDSVDNAIEKELWPLMENRVKKDEWEIAIAHFLGVDHCGHTYGPSDPNMARKLTQMNSVIERLLQQVDNDTLLLIMGDHGMSVDGDHGGESVEELMSTLFLYSGRPLTLQEPYFQSLYERIHNARAALLGYDLDGIAQRLHYNPKSYPIVAQIHLVPTLAYLLNTPIPFGNLGAIIPNLLVPNLQAEEYSPINKQLYTLWHMVEEFRKNSLQVHVYLENYQNQTHQLDFSSDKLAPIVQHLYDAETILTNLLQQRLFTESLSNENKNSKSNSQIQQYIEQLEQVILAYDAFLISTIKYCEAIWAQFDTGCMILGIILLSLGAAATLSIASSQPQQQRQQLRKTTSTTISTITISNSVFVICILSLLGTSIFTYVRYQILGQYFLARNWFEKMGFIDWLGTGVALALTASILVLSLSKKQGKTFDSISRSNNSIPSSWWNLNDRQTIVIAATIQSFTLGSNSYVVWEDRGTLYILNTLAVVWAIRNLKSLHSVSIKAIVTSFGFPLLFMALIRISNVTGQCREEQFPYCDYVHSGMLEFGFDTTGYFTIAYVAVMYTLIVYFSGFLYRLKGLFYTGIYQISSLLVVLRFIYEIAQKSFDSTSAASITENAVDITANVQKYMDVYIPRLVYGLVILGTIIVIIQWVTAPSVNREKQLHWSWTLYLYWTTLLAIIQRPIGALIVLSSPFLIRILSEKASHSTLLIRLTLLHFLGHHLYYVTGHQATFTSLPWKAAFVGFDDMNYYGGMILVALSTITGYILSWLGWLVILSHALLLQERQKDDVNAEKKVSSDYKQLATDEIQFDTNDVHHTLYLLPSLHTISTSLCAIFIFVLRRHLMTWKIFAPRFLLQVIIEVCSYIAAIVIRELLH